MEEFFMNLEFKNIIWQIVTPLIFSLFDIITGYVQAFINKNVDSKKMREGLLHKFLLLTIIFIGFIIQFAFGIKHISVGICLYICLMELTSILENLKKAGIELKITNFLKGDDNNESK